MCLRNDANLCAPRLSRSRPGGGFRGLGYRLVHDGVGSGVAVHGQVQEGLEAKAGQVGDLLLTGFDGKLQRLEERLAISPFREQVHAPGAENVEELSRLAEEWVREANALFTRHVNDLATAASAISALCGVNIVLFESRFTPEDESLLVSHVCRHLQGKVSFRSIRRDDLGRYEVPYDECGLTTARRANEHNERVRRYSCRGH